MANEFTVANDAASDRVVDLMLGFTSKEPEKSAETEPAEAAPAEGAVGTTPTNADGAEPETPEVAEAKVESEPVTEPEVAAQDFDPEKTLSKYTTQEEKDKALVEASKALHERQQENKKLRAELEKRGVPEKETEPEVAVEDYPTFLQRVNAARPEELSPDESYVASSLSKLRSDKAGLTKIEEAVREFRAKENEINEQAAKVRVVLESQLEDQKADPDDYALQGRVDANKAKLEQFRRDLADIRSERIDKTQEYQIRKSEFDTTIIDLESRAQSTHGRLTQSKQATAARTEESARLNAKWMEATKKLFDGDLKNDAYTPLEQKVVTRALADALADHVEKTGAVPSDFLQWQRGQKQVFEEVRALRSESQKALLTRKASDLPGKPKDNIARSSPGGKTSSYAAHMKTRDAMFDRALGL